MEKTTQSNATRRVESLTLLVLKDQLPARTLRVPVAWFSRLGWAIAISGVLVLASMVVSVRYYWIAKDTDPTRVHQLEDQLAQWKAKALSLAIAPGASTLPLTTAPTAAPTSAPVESAPTLAPTAVPTTAPTSMPTQQVALPTAAPIAQLAAPITVHTPPGYQVPAQPLVLAPKATSADTVGTLFSAVPAGTQHVAQPSVTMTDPEFVWKGTSSLRVRFNLQYIREDGGKQSGTIVILARGRETVLAYPDGVLNEPGAPSLVAPDRGERFGLSRLREVIAEFGPVKSRKSLGGIDVLIFDENGQILIHQKWSVPQAPLPSAGVTPRAPVRTVQPTTGAAAPVTPAGAASGVAPSAAAPAPNGNGGSAQ